MSLPTSRATARISILRREQAARAGAEGDGHAFWIFRIRLRAVPQARAAHRNQELSIPRAAPFTAQPGFWRLLRIKRSVPIAIAANIIVASDAQ